ncbi:MAG: hypothetical protein JWN23_1569 [Rhodocyclales bacterium]|nr:hypothetical protein [Rhodocyclales bacterium]
MIQPTVGRVILFNPNGSGGTFCPSVNGAPLPALVALVWSDRLINVGGFDANGVPFAACSLKLLQDDDAIPDSGTAYACWMPYQTGQAAKTVALEKQIVTLGTGPSIEQEIQDKGMTAPRITPDDIERTISREYYFTANDGVVGHGIVNRVGSSLEPVLGLLTFCVLVLVNGFTVTGESACVSAENFDAEIGRKIARKNAVEKIWPLEGYRLRLEINRQHEVVAPSSVVGG